MLKPCTIIIIIIAVKYNTDCIVDNFDLIRGDNLVLKYRWLLYYTAYM